MCLSDGGGSERLESVDHSSPVAVRSKLRQRGRLKFRTHAARFAEREKYRERQESPKPSTLRVLQ